MVGLLPTLHYWLANDIADNRLTIKAFGESQPIETNNTESGQMTNRRVEFIRNGNY